MTVKIEDPFGNLVTTDNTDSVTVGIATGPGAFTGASTATVNASGGVATFSNLIPRTHFGHSTSERKPGHVSGLSIPRPAVSPSALEPQPN